jgi:hypothetical protein
MILALILAIAAAGTTEHGVRCPHPHRSKSVIAQFKKLHPAPRIADDGLSCATYRVDAKGKFHLFHKDGACQVDHKCALACCGQDRIENLQWLSAPSNNKKSDDCRLCPDWAAVDKSIKDAAAKTDAMLKGKL